MVSEVRDEWSVGPVGVCERENKIHVAIRIGRNF